jgi:stress response protein YsnF
VTDTREVRAGDDASGGEGRVVQLKPGETLRVQVVEEELVVQKVPRVTREVVVQAQPRVEQVEQDIELRRERVDVHRMGDVDVDMADEEPARRRA